VALQFPVPGRARRREAAGGRVALFTNTIPCFVRKGKKTILWRRWKKRTLAKKVKNPEVKNAIALYT